MSDAISWVRVSACTLPLANPISDAKVLTGRQKPMTEIAILFVEIKTRDGAEGTGFSYSKRAGGPGQFAHAKEIAPVLIGERARAGIRFRISTTVWTEPLPWVELSPTTTARP